MLKQQKKIKIKIFLKQQRNKENIDWHYYGINPVQNPSYK